MGEPATNSQQTEAHLQFFILIPQNVGAVEADEDVHHKERPQNQLNREPGV